MKPEDKELLLIDLSARQPYGVCVHIRYKEGEPCYGKLTPRDIQWFIDSNIENIKPYLRPMSSMTEEEKEEYKTLCIEETFTFATWQKVKWYDTWKSIDWLNKHHFDYRGLIEKGLAIEVTEENNPYESIHK